MPASTGWTSTSGSARRSSGWTGTTQARRWRVATVQDGEPRNSPRRIAVVAAPRARCTCPRCPDVPGSRRVHRQDVPLGALGPRVRPRRQARRRRRDRRVRDPVHPEDPAAGRAAHRLPAHAAVGPPAPRPRRCPRRAAISSRRRTPPSSPCAAASTRTASSACSRSSPTASASSPSATPTRSSPRPSRIPVLRAKLRPDYRIGCKRILLSDDYLPALAQPNVEVSSPIRIRELGGHRHRRRRRPHPRARRDHLRHRLRDPGLPVRARDPRPRRSHAPRGVERPHGRPPRHDDLGIPEPVRHHGARTPGSVTRA